MKLTIQGTVQEIKNMLDISNKSVSFNSDNYENRPKPSTERKKINNPY